MDITFQGFQLVALGAFLLLFLGRSLQLRLTHGVQPFVIGRGKPLAAKLLEGSLVLVLPAYLVLLVAYARPVPALLPPEAWNPVVLDAAWAPWAGVALVSAGIGLFAWALASFGRSWRVGIDLHSPGELVTRGVFALSRNPIFLFMDLYALGTFLLNGRLWFLAVALFTPAALHWQILQEERFLRGRHGAAYLDYLARVPRYLGLPRTTRRTA